MKANGKRYSFEDRVRFVDLVCAGSSLGAAAVAVGASAQIGTRWWRQSGGMTLKSSRTGGGLADPVLGVVGTGRVLSLDERVGIQIGTQLNKTHAEIARIIGRHRSVVLREVGRNSGPDGAYIATAAHTRAHQKRRRPKAFKLIENTKVCTRIETWMDQGWSPKLISLVLARDHAGDQTMQVSHETIYQALYVQTRGSLRADLNQKLSLKRRKRVASGTDRTANSPYGEAFGIRDRPAEADDRAVPGHWEGDLIVGTANGSAIGTLVERATRFTILLHLPNGHSAEEVAAAMIREMKHLPDHLRRSITWDRGTELAAYKDIQIALDTKLFFCDPHSPWQRGTNENTNRLLRFWFEKGTDLSVHNPADLRRAQDLLNTRPRPTLNLDTPAMRMKDLLTAA